MTTFPSPSLIVCGSQIGTPDAAFLSRLWSNLAHYPELQPLRQAVLELPELWQLLVLKDPSLDALDVATTLQGLARWTRSHTFSVLPVGVESSRNTQLAILTVLSHITEYASYLRTRAGEASCPDLDVAHTELLGGLREGGIQGLCIGLLSASAIACSRNKADVAQLGATAIRLAMCVGSYIDLDGWQSTEDFVSVAVRLDLRMEDGEEQLNTVLESLPQVCRLQGQRQQEPGADLIDI